MSRHRASSMINIYGTNYCADHTNGNIYEYSLDILSDNGDPIVKERDTAVIHGGLFGEPDAKLFYDEVEFIIVSGYRDQSGTGAGPQPVEPFTPVTNLVSETGGFAATQEDYWGSTYPDLPHPFEGEQYAEFTMSMIGRINEVPFSAVTSSCAFNLNQFGGPTKIEVYRIGSGAVKFRAYMESWELNDSTLEMWVDVDEADATAWYWIGASYRKDPISRQLWIVNLETGVETAGQAAADFDGFVSWKSNAGGSESSTCYWAMNTKTVTNQALNWWRGELSQILIHNKYIDLSDAANRRKFCGLTGVIDYGGTGSGPFLETPLVYLPNGHPSSNVGTKFIGTWKSDFWLSPDWYIGDLPPIFIP